MSLNCRTTQDLFSDFYDGGLPTADRRLIEDHLRTCGDCTSEYRHFTESLGALHETGPLETTKMFLANVRAAAAAHLDRRDHLLKEPSEAVTMITPKADAKGAPPAAAAPPSAPAPAAAEAEVHVPAWVPWALAATTFVAFVVGWAVSGRRSAPVDEERLASLVEERLRKLPPAPLPAAEPADPVRVLSEQGLVLHQGQWIPRKMRDDFARGWVAVGGRLMPREEAAKLLAKELPAEAPAPPAPTVVAPSEDEVLGRLLEREKLVRTGAGALVPQDWVRKWEEGWIQTGPDAWRKASEVRDEFVKEQGLVEHRGRWMTREQAEALLAVQRIKPPAGASASNELTRSLEGMEVGAPLSFRGLTVWPLLAARPSPDSACVTLHAALDSGRLELSDTLGLFQVQAKNGLDQDVVLLAGELLSGGRCARVVAEDVILRAGQSAKVAAYCAEPSAWRTADRFAKESGHHLAPPAMRRALAGGQGQGAVWTSLGRRLWKGATPADLYRKHAEPLAEIRAHFGALPDREASATGLAVGWGDSLELVELFPTHDAFAAWFDRVLAGCAIDLLDRAAEPGSPRGAAAWPNSPEGVKRLLEAAFLAGYEPAESGYAVRRDDSLSGRVTVAAGGLQHAVLFASAAAVEEDRKAGAAVPREKARRVVDELESRLKSAGPAARAGLIHELGALGLADAVPVLVRQLGQADPAARRAAARELGLSGDARAAEPLLQLLSRSRQEAPVFAEAARALGRLGDERAAEPMLKLADPAEPENAKSVLAAAPELLLQVRTREVLERSMTRLVGLFESWDGPSKNEALLDPVGKTARPPEMAGLADAARAALKQLAGLEFGSGAGARKWWNDRDVRERWLRERTGK